MYDVAWLSLVRDYHTADGYGGHRVRVRLSRKEYKVVGRELHVWVNDGRVPPVLVFALNEPLGEGEGWITVLGECRGPVRDGVRRSPRVDFSVRIENCTVSH